MYAALRGKFSFSTAPGVDATPRAQKERAILAILALSTGQRRSRKWLQSCLWSGRFPEQASVSLRRALSNLRQTLGDDAGILKADREDVWLDAEIGSDLNDRSAGGLLEDLHIEDPAFATWRRALRYRIDGDIDRGQTGAPVSNTIDRIEICATVAGQTGDERLATQIVTDVFASYLRTLGPVDVEVTDDGDAQPRPGPAPLWRIEIQGSRTDASYLLYVRAFHAETRRFLWSGRLTLPFDCDRICGSPELANFVGGAVVAIQRRDRSNSGIFPNLLAATRKVFLGDPVELELADRILAQVELEDAEGVAQAWRAYVGLTRVLEHGQRGADVAAQSLGFATEAEDIGSDNALVAALSAQVRMKVGGDMDRGRYLAGRAHEISEVNPFALHAMSQTRIQQGDFLAAYKYAETGRKPSAALSNSYCWDMQTCLAALGIGRRDEAYRLAWLAHSKMQSYRPALRYLAALSLLDERHDDAAKWGGRLKELEPDFELSDLFSSSYPLDTLRILGLQDEMTAIWGGALPDQGANRAAAATAAELPDIR